MLVFCEVLGTMTKADLGKEGKCPFRLTLEGDKMIVNL